MSVFPDLGTSDDSSLSDSVVQDEGKTDVCFACKSNEKQISARHVIS